MESVSLSVIIPTLNAARSLPATLAALGEAGDIVVADGGSTDDTLEVAIALGARTVGAAAGRGLQLIAGEAIAHGPWLLFLHADTILEAGWRDEVGGFMSDPANSTRAATFRFALDDESREARRLEALVAWRVTMLGLPYGDQGLLIHREFYQSLGGFRPWPLMEDVDFIRRIGHHRVTVFRSAARTSAERWRQDGWKRRSLRNITCLTLYFVGVPPRLIARLYG
ncbi:MAG TPA: TIGR04283 family arsenosugar biosynthesis glycosyltransferase [Candidatus Binataceae bacterium]|nr:TIGR04283 family arsenosugar biosynthesis glycosyltransferase [Candidatus Binataceae bacterium]